MAASKLSDVHSPAKWLEYVGEQDAALAERVSEWLLTPDVALLPPDAAADERVPIELRAKLTERRTRILAALKTYHAVSARAMAPKADVVIKHLAWSWTYAYGNHNWFNFESMEGHVAVIRGPNASGKSSFLDTLCIAIFGEPGKHRNPGGTGKLTPITFHHQRPKHQPVQTAVTLAVEGVVYTLVRAYGIKETKAGEATECKTCELYRNGGGGDGGGDNRSLLLSGTGPVDAWVETHCGRLEDVVRTMMVCQNDPYDFFSMKPTEQKEQIDEALQLGALQAFGDALNVAMRSYAALLDMLDGALSVMVTQADENGEANGGASGASGDLGGFEALGMDALLLEQDRWTAVKDLSEASHDDCVARVAHTLGANALAPDLTHDLAKKRVAELHLEEVPLETVMEWSTRLARISRGYEGGKAEGDGGDGGDGGEGDGDGDVIASDVALSLWKKKRDAAQAAMEKWEAVGGELIASEESCRARLADIQRWSVTNHVWIENAETTWAHHLEKSGALEVMECAFATWQKTVVPEVHGGGNGGGLVVLDSAKIEAWPTWVEKWKKASVVAKKAATALDRLVRHRPATTERTKEDHAAWLKELDIWERVCAEIEEEDYPELVTCQENAAAAAKFSNQLRDWTLEASHADEKATACTAQIDDMETDAAWVAAAAEWEATLASAAKVEAEAEAVDDSALEALVARLKVCEEAERNVVKLECKIGRLQTALNTSESTWKLWERRVETLAGAGAGAGAGEDVNVEERARAAIAAVENYDRCEAALALAQSESEALSALPFNPECWACCQHPVRCRLTKTITDATAQLKALGKRASLVKARDKWTELREISRWVERERVAMEGRMAQEKAWEAANLACVAARECAAGKMAALADVNACERDRALLADVEKRRAFMDVWTQSRATQMSKWVEERDLALRRAAKRNKAIAKAGGLVKAGESLAYWESAVEAMSKYERRPAMEREKAAWAAAEKAWESEEADAAAEAAARDAWNTADEKEKAAHALAYATWHRAGENLKADIRETGRVLKNIEDVLETHPRMLEEKERLEEALVAWVRERERRMAKKALAEAEARVAGIEGRLMAVDLKHRLEAVGALAWHEVRDWKHRREEATAACGRIRRAIEAHARASRERSGHALLLGWKKDWAQRCEDLGVLHARLVGGGKKATDMGGNKATDVGTFREWIYTCHVLPLLETQINDFLAPIDAAIRVRIVYQPKALQFMVMDRGNETNVAGSSGYQQFMVGLGMRRALANIGGSGNALKHMWIDEGFTACDAENVEKVPGMLRGLRESCGLKSVFIMSHTDAFKKTIPIIVNVEREEGFSRLCYSGSAIPRTVAASIVEDAAEEVIEERVVEPVVVTAPKRGRPKKGATLST